MGKMFVCDIAVIEMTRFTEEGSMAGHNFEDESVATRVVEKVFLSDRPAVETMRCYSSRPWKIVLHEGFTRGMAGRDCLPLDALRRQT